MQLCVRCQRVLTDLIMLHEPPDKHMYWEDLKTVEHYHPPQLILKSAQDCQLCRLLVSTVVDDMESEEGVTLGHVIAQHGASRLKAMECYDHGGPNCSTSILFLLTCNAPFYTVHVCLRIWAEDNSPVVLSGKLSCHPPPLADNCPSAIHLIKSWLRKCRTSHASCQLTLSGQSIDVFAEPRLPSRVLDLMADLSSETVKLVQSNGQYGFFTALSYCWGPPEHQTLQATSATISDLLNGVAVSSLPKTLQDAISITRDIGVRYLWVDVLCILQDDIKDWQDQAAHMHEIYGNALLTVMALESEHADQGCFIPRKSYNNTWMEVSDAEGLIAEPTTYYMSTCSTSSREDFVNRIEPALKKRAWAVQERLLSPRKIMFTRRGLAWKCRTLDAVEDGTMDDLGDYDNWKHFINEYTKTQLFLESDRLIAIKGLVNELQKGRTDQCHFGMWTANFPFNLTWTQMDRQPRDSRNTNLPSWTWASAQGRKNMWSGPLQSDDKSSRSACAEVRLEGSGDKLLLRAPTKTFNIDHPTFRKMAYGQYAFLFSPEQSFQFAARGEHYLLQEHGDGFSLNCGLAALDHDSEPRTQILCLLLWKSQRERHDPWATRSENLKKHDKEWWRARKDRILDEVKDKSLDEMIEMLESLERGEGDEGDEDERVENQSGVRKEKTKMNTEERIMAQKHLRVERLLEQILGHRVEQALEGLVRKDHENFKMSFRASFRGEHDRAEGDCVYWALLVEPVVDNKGNHTGQHRRIGVGIVWPQALEGGQPPTPELIRLV